MGLFEKKDSDGRTFFVEYVTTKMNITEMALQVGVNRIADVIAKCGFTIISKDTSSKAEVDYKLNVRPNPNQTATDFWKQAIEKMIIEDDGCVIVNLNGNIYIADSWRVDESITKEKKYTNVVLTDGEGHLMNLKKSFKASDVAHLRYTNTEIVRLLRGVNGDIDKMVGTASEGFNARAPKVKVTMPGKLAIKNEAGETITSNDYANMIADKLKSKEIKAIISHSGIDISTLDTKSTLSSQDVATLRELIFANTAAALGIPKNILLGDVVNQSNEEFLTYACEPIIKILDNVLNSTWLTKDEYLQGDRIIVNRLCMKHIDVIDSANNLDKLYQNGWSHNDIMKLLGQPQVDEDWANLRRFTKNYAEEGGTESEQ